MHSFLRLLALSLALAAALPALAQERRLALVVGNAEYRSLARLATPAADARAVSDALRRSGFEVALQENVDERALRRALRDFTDRVDSAGPGGVALVYLSGYALAADGANFFLPVSAQLRRPQDVGLQGLSVDDVLGALAATGAGLRIVLVDAARAPSNLDRQSFGAAGLVAALPPEQTVVGFASQPGAVAAEGERNSPYAASLARQLGAPGLQIEESLRQVRCEVYAATGGQQIPWSASAYIGTFVPVPGQVRGADACAPAPAGTASTGPGRGAAVLPAAIPLPRERSRGAVRVTREKLRALPPERAYEEVLEDGSVEAYETFVELYPSDPRTVYFRDRVRARQESDVWIEVVEENTPQAYERYLRRFPYGAYRTQAVVRIERSGGRVPDLPPPPREYYDEAWRPRATIVGPGISGPHPREVFVPGGQINVNQGRPERPGSPAQQPAPGQPVPPALRPSQGAGAPAPAQPGQIAPAPGIPGGQKAAQPGPAPTAQPGAAAPLPPPAGVTAKPAPATPAAPPAPPRAAQPAPEAKPAAAAPPAAAPPAPAPARAASPTPPAAGPPPAAPAPVKSAAPPPAPGQIPAAAVPHAPAAQSPAARPVPEAKVPPAAAAPQSPAPAARPTPPPEPKAAPPVPPAAAAPHAPRPAAPEPKAAEPRTTPSAASPATAAPTARPASAPEPKAPAPARAAPAPGAAPAAGQPPAPLKKEPAER